MSEQKIAPEPNAVGRVMAEKSSALATIAEQKQLTAQTDEERKREQIEWLLSKVPDWNKPPVPIRAAILQQRPWKTKDGFSYMSFGEALGAVVYCEKRGVDETSEEFWYDPVNKRYNLSSEGELAYARHRGYNWTVPRYQHLSRDWANPRSAITGFPKELGCICSMKLKTDFGEEEISSEVWMSEWYVGTNPNWQTRTRWMLEVRSLSNAIKRGTGAAISANLLEATLNVPAEEVPELPTIKAQKIEWRTPPEPVQGDLEPILKASIAEAENKKNKS